MKVVNNLGKFGWPIALGMSTFVLCAAASMLLAVTSGGYTPDSRLAGYFPPFPRENATPFWGPVGVYYLCVALYYVALAGCAVAFVCMLISPRRKPRTKQGEQPAATGSSASTSRDR